MALPGGSWSLIVAAVTDIEARLGKWLVAQHGVGLTEYRAIMQLAEAPERELRITELAERVGLNQSSATRLVGRLESKDLAFRDTCPDDGRGVYAVITDKGVSLVQDLSESYTEKLTDLLNAYTKHGSGPDSQAIRSAFHHLGDMIS
ncbi:MAG: MarR family transcriptional regulator [Corynebacterium sp.]|nr:MarR family transcriptional regulator [Corynebacterium sp.]